MVWADRANVGDEPCAPSTVEDHVSAALQVPRAHGRPPSRPPWFGDHGFRRGKHITGWRRNPESRVLHERNLTVRVENSLQPVRHRTKLRQYIEGRLNTALAEGGDNL